ALIGSALTLGLSLVLFSMSLKIGDAQGLSGTPEAREKVLLSKRVEDAQQRGNSNASQASGDLVGRYDWIKQFNIQYYLGADGISMSLVLVTTVVTFLAVIASWRIDKFVRGYFMLLLILESGMLGTFLALDFFLFFIFWEVMLLPMYFLIGVWGGPRREYAA